MTAYSVHALCDVCDGVCSLPSRHSHLNQALLSAAEVSPTPTVGGHIHSKLFIYPCHL